MNEFATTPLLAEEESSASVDQAVCANRSRSDSASTTISAVASASPTTESYRKDSARALFFVLSSTYFGLLLAAMDTTLIATLAVPISVSFDSLALTPWIASAYFIANATFQPIAGRFTDIYGRKRGLVISNGLLSLGHLVCCLSPNKAIFILGRVVAGSGGGGLPVIAAFVMTDLVPLRQRGAWQALSNIPFAIGSALGGVLGGVMNDRLGWRAPFMLQAVLAIGSGVLVMAMLEKSSAAESDPRKSRIDFLGTALLAGSLVLFFLGLILGGNHLSFTSPWVMLILCLSAIGITVFIFVESNIRLTPVPVIPVRLLLSRTIVAACLTDWFMSMAVFALLFQGQAFLQMLGESAARAGVVILPYSIAVVTGSFTSGFGMRQTGRYYYLLSASLLLLVFGSALFGMMGSKHSDWKPAISFALVGLAYGSALTIVLVALISSVSQADQAVITSAQYAFRSTGSVLGVTIVSVVFQSRLKVDLWSLFQNKTDAAKVLHTIISEGPDAFHSLPKDWQERAVQAYVRASQSGFWAILALAMLAAFSGLLIRENKLNLTLERSDEE